MSGAPDPFEQLTRSHRRLEERLADLAHAVRQDPPDLEAAREVADFLARQVARHEEDEERSLFPRLEGIAELAHVLGELASGHVAQRELASALEGAIGRAERADLVRAADALEDAYRTHIDVEEAVLFPAARRALDPRDLEAMHAEMQARRGGGGQRRDRR